MVFTSFQVMMRPQFENLFQNKVLSVDQFVYLGGGRGEGGVFYTPKHCINNVDLKERMKLNLKLFETLGHSLLF